MSLQGKETKRFTLPPHNDFITLTNGDFIVTHYEDQVIRRVTSVGKVSDIVSTKPLYPTWISKTHTGGILVTLNDDGDPFKLKPSSRRLVQRMTLTGNVLHTYEFREDGITRLFTVANRTTENGNSDICIINATSDDTANIMSISREGRVRFTYKGQENTEFDPYDLACDMKRRTIVADYASKSLHLLGPDGRFLRYILSKMNVGPSSVALFEGSLWIGFDDGTVKVFKYTD